jgi:crotonobetainyl-CoA:carnitine CoA-transferase CaiB-like acyl-CoA transferase
VFRTADGELMIAAANDRLFAELCERIGLPELASDPRFASNPERVAHREELLTPIRDRLAERGSADWLRILEGIPVAPVQDLAQVAQDEQVRAGGMIGEVDGVETVGVPLQVDGERPAHAGTPPTLGRDSAEVLAELGYSDTEIASLTADGVVVSSP